MVMLLLPASRASSTYASCKNQSIGSVVLAHYQETVGVQAGGGALNSAGGLVDDDPAAGGIAGCACEAAEDGRLVFPDDGFHCGDEGEEDVCSTGLVACADSQRRGLTGQIARKRLLVHVDTDAGDGRAFHQLH